MSSTKMHQYKCLCEKTAAALLTDPCNQVLNTVFENCPECKEINLWTYWHGRESLDAQNDAVHPKILVVGQDWGCTASNITVKERLMRMGDDPKKYKETFHLSNNGATTDDHLRCLFRKIDYDLDKEQPDLFFTNLIPYYRKSGIKISGFKRSWLTPTVKDSFCELVRILEPKVILCLGKNTYRGVLDSFGLGKGKLMEDPYNTFLDSHHNFQKHTLSTGAECTIFALAHCGGLGVRNRNKKDQCEDWKNLKRFL